MPRLSVLLVEGDEEEAEQFRRSLLEPEPEAELLRARSAAEAARLLGERGFDVIAVQDRLGAEDGLELVRRLRGDGVEAPILMLTDRGGEEAAVEALRAGVTDYLARTGLGPDALRRSLRYARDLSRQAALRRHAEEALRLREEQLRETQRLETVATLSGGIAHEFNNLLNVIVGYGDMMRRRLPDGDPLHRHVEHILQAADKATALTRQLLAFGRSQVLQPAVLDSAALVNELAPVVRSVLGRRIELVVRAEPNLGRIKADRSQIDHALMNLIVNARDAMPEGGRLTLEAANLDVDAERGLRSDPVARRGRYVAFAVTDTGEGMPTDVQARAFEPFFTTRGRANATGLGLSTVYGIVKQSGGHAWLESEPGRGTTVRILLPRVDAAGNPERLAAPAVAAGSEVVLLVDDESAMREVLSLSLQEAGYTVLEAADAAQALRLSEQTPGEVHLLLTDVMMPGLSGPELAVRIRAARPGVRVVYMSGATKEALRQRDQAIDAPFLWKPFTTEQLTQAIRQVLDGR